MKTWLLGLASFVLVAGAAEAASAQCSSGCEPPPPPPPPPPPCCEPPPAPPCCGGGNINVNVNVNANANANAGARAYVNARAGVYGSVQGRGGGSAYVSVDQPYPTVINGLNVEGARVQQVIRTPFTATRRWEKRVVIQAVCIDDRSVPHPASQVFGDRDVRDDFEGELYRCIAGSRLQVTIAEFLGDIRFEHGETLSCRKGEALWRGRGGDVVCKPQLPARDCNERSLLRRFGAGVKILTMVREETYTEYREEVVETQGYAVQGASIALDGGVGGRVF